MKICWDNLEKLRYSKRTGKWYNKHNDTFVYISSCKICGMSYLTNLSKHSDFCSNSCSQMGKFRKHNSPLWKGGVTENNTPLYDTYAHQISYAEKVRRNKEDENILEVKCTYCGKWHVPKANKIRNRVQSLNGSRSGEHRLYCSDECKKECPIYWKHLYSAEETNTKYYSREVQPELRQMVFERDNWTCQKCGSKESLHSHHITGVELNPIESADIDNCLTLCKECHEEVHSEDGCKRSDYRRKKCEKEKYYE